MSGIRRNISGIYIFDKFEGEDKKSPTCFEDCQEETQLKWLETLDPEGLKNLAMILGASLKRVCEQFDIQSAE